MNSLRIVNIISLCMIALTTVVVFAIPNAFTELKFIIYIFGLILVVIKLIEKGMTVHRKLFMFASTFIYLNIFFIFYGSYKGAPDNALYLMFKLFVIYPVIALLFVNYLKDIDCFIFISKGILFASTLIVTFVCFLLFEILMGQNLLPETIRTELHILNDTGGGYFHVATTGINSLFFVMPILYGMMFKKDFSNIWRFVCLVVFILTIFAVLISGRRALIALAIMIPLFFILHKIVIYGFKLKLFYNHIFVFLIFLFLSLSTLIFFSSFINSDTTIFDRFSEEFTDESVRIIQSTMLLRGFVEAPLLGNGVGIGLAEVVRDTERPWMYELTYHQMLFNIGLIGLFAYTLLFAWSYYIGISSVKAYGESSDIALGFLIGFLFLLIASASNPYISNFEAILMLYSPMLILVLSPRISLTPCNITS